MVALLRSPASNVERRTSNVERRTSNDTPPPWPPIQVIVSGELAQTLIRHDLVDSYRLMIHPLVLGTGKRLFREGTSMTKLRLVNSKPTTTGVLILTYEPEKSSLD